MKINAQNAWKAVTTRDAGADGKFVFAVKTTGIYCRPSCAARRALRDNVVFYGGPAEAEKSGYRACLRCRPKEDSGSDAELVRRACRLIVTRAETEEAWLISDIARELKVAPSKLSRLFSRHAGTTPKKFAVARRFDKFRRGVRSNGVTESQYAAGFGSPSRLYEAARGYLGMTPGAYANGGRGETISFGFISSAVGEMLIAFTPKGLCSVELGDSHKDLEKRLCARFPRAELRHDAKAAAAAGRSLSAVMNGKISASSLAVDPRGTAFQRLVWEALRRIPVGKTKTYSQVARDIGRPSAARAVARVCATNSIAVAIPCHRVVGSDGGLRGYRWGPERKKRLLELEGARHVS
jgi:AraC family transcriptional regulator of adaptative response/methylated-DNA-[protein]-cysteine methyltransferase